jgi:hypothetical protein
MYVQTATCLHASLPRSLPCSLLTKPSSISITISIHCRCNTRLNLCRATYPCRIQMNHIQVVPEELWNLCNLKVLAILARSNSVCYQSATITIMFLTY